MYISTFVEIAKLFSKAIVPIYAKSTCLKFPLQHNIVNLNMIISLSFQKL